MNSIPIQVTELLNYSYSIAKSLLKEQKEFFPFGVSIDYEGNINQRLVNDGDEFQYFEPWGERLNSNDN